MALRSPLTRHPLGNAERQRSLSVVGVAALMTLLAPPHEIALGLSEEDPCDGVFMGARLSASFLDMSLTLSSLKLLDGRENPKLKRILEWRFASAIRDARRAIENNPVIDPGSLPTMALNWQHSVADAKRFIIDHHLEAVSLTPGSAGRDVLRPLEDLKPVEDWLSKQPLPPQSEW